jgi:hypothetical protein
MQSGHKAVVGARKQFGFGLVDFLRRHARLRPDLVDAVIDHGAEVIDRQQLSRHRVIRPQQVALDPKPARPEPEPGRQQLSVDDSQAAIALQRYDQRRPDPKPAPHPAGRRQAAHKTAKNPAQIMN